LAFAGCSKAIIQIKKLRLFWQLLLAQSGGTVMLMKIVQAKDVPYIVKPEGTSVRYYLFKDYEIHYNDQAANMASSRKDLGDTIHH
jgi:hypothetical protein